MIFASMRREVRDEHAPVGDVEQPESQSLTRLDHELCAALAVDQDRVAPATVVREVVPRVEGGRNLTVGAEQDVVEHPELVARVRRWIPVLDDERAEQAALDLLARAQVRVEPEGARVLRRELVGESRTGLDRGLRDPRDAVHLVRHADAVPVDGGRLRQLVGEAHAQRVAEPDAQGGAGDLAVVRPGVEGLAIAERNRRRRCDQIELADLARSCVTTGERAEQSDEQCRCDDAAVSNVSGHGSVAKVALGTTAPARAVSRRWSMR